MRPAAPDCLKCKNFRASLLRSTDSIPTSDKVDDNMPNLALRANKNKDENKTFHARIIVNRRLSTLVIAFPFTHTAELICIENKELGSLESCFLGFFLCLFHTLSPAQWLQMDQ